MVASLGLPFPKREGPPDDVVVHHMRPGVFRGTMILCEYRGARKRGDMVAELSLRGIKQVNCPDCKFIMHELSKLWRLT